MINLPIEILAKILQDAGKPAPPLNIATNWPLLQNELQIRGMNSNDCLVAAFATIAIETGSFSPCKERGGVAYLAKLYEGRADLGNVHPGDGERYRGRGFVQITGRANYRTIGHAIGVDLENNPDLALDPAISAKVFAEFFQAHHVADAANAKNWELVRRRVNGGLTGWAPFIRIIDELTAAIEKPIPADTVTAAIEKPISAISEGAKTMDWMKYLSLVVQLAPLIVATIQKVHGDAPGTEKKQLATEAIHSAATTALGMNPGDKTLIQATAEATSGIIEAALAEKKATGQFPVKTAAATPANPS